MLEINGLKFRNFLGVYFDITIDGKATGRITMELDADLFPKTAENFRALCTGEKGPGMSGHRLHFKGSRFFLVKPKFYCCGGDIVEDDGSCGESIYGEDFEFEKLNDFSGRGDLAMGYVDGVHSSQFFITFVHTRWLNGDYPVFGKVVDGWAVLDEIEEAADKDGRLEKEIGVTSLAEEKEKIERNWRRER
ncbi:hypothetical protein Tsubulata_004171 [Turnera subulata]|uniref:Peptidyl-prolyl cis-trans isomerase n=1 Tax=Turnera subulata TaxID=218843 RepID=A0A9Q0FBS2_9ROSI|nr:hypothetical protein Tsubulata_004171 [Turnera subulata]